jgi:NMD protein affecting ribosome stability and mRNA decay
MRREVPSKYGVSFRDDANGWGRARYRTIWGIKCYSCGEPSKGRTLCRRCAARRNKVAREKRERMVAAGLCYRCGDKTDRPGRTCRECAAALVIKRECKKERERQ